MNDIWIADTGSLAAGKTTTGLSYFRWEKEQALSAPIFQGAQEIGARELASLTVIFSKYHEFFKRVHGVETRYKNDINGSGQQFRSFSIKNSEDVLVVEFGAYFHSTSTEVFVYEADLWSDQRKDCLPTLNRGKHKFDIDSVYVSFHDQDNMFEWVKRSYSIIISHLELFKKNRDDLIRWTETGLDMRVVCYMPECRNASIISNEQLTMLRKKGFVLASLSQKLRCSKCGSQQRGHLLMHKLLPEIPKAVSTIQDVR